jgi:ABC-type lipoprotein release transport system permease subunit
MDLELGSTITFVSPALDDVTLIVVGIFDFNVLAINSTWSITTLGTARTILGIDAGVGQIEMQIADVFAAEEIDQAIITALDDPSIKSENWIENIRNC